MAVFKASDIRKKEKELLRRACRACRALSLCNRARVNAVEEYELLKEICRIVVDEGGYLVAWVGYVAKEEGIIYPVVSEGRAKRHPGNAGKACSEVGGRTWPAIAALRKGEPYVCRYASGDSGDSLSPSSAKNPGIASSISIPLTVREETFGVLSVCSEEKDAFGELESELLVNLANDLAQGIWALRVRAEHGLVLETLQRERDRAQGYLDVAEVILLALDRSGRVTMINRKGCEIFGCREDEILGRDVFDNFLPERYGEKVRAALDEFMDGKRASMEYNENPILRKDGEERIIAWHNALLRDEAGNATGILCSGLDITERRRMEEELKKAYNEMEARVEERTAELAVAKERAESADRLKSAFLATMSHELRTPLNSIIGFTGILLQGLAGPLNDEQAKQLGMVKESAHHLLDLINDVLDISKIEAGQLEIASEVFDMRDAIGKAVRTVAPLAEKKGLAMRVDVSPDVGEVTSDRRRVEQILLNLLSNAVKFTDEGEVRIEGAVAGPRLVIRVMDTGIGIKPEEMGKLFKAFQQIDTGLARSSEGTGLGLAISVRLAEMLGGEITVESEYGRGSTFALCLPSGRGGGENGR